MLNKYNPNYSGNESINIKKKPVPPRWSEIQNEIDALISKFKVSKFELISFVMRALDKMPKMTDTEYSLFFGMVNQKIEKKDYKMALHYLDFLIRDIEKSPNSPDYPQKASELYSKAKFCNEQILNNLVQ